ncbi:hypothetical protein [Lentzea sp. NPDC003310]|uniref:hypothetical protein n=1 Tax=Lentzea sp. NPDC003310 TaxID=3154447 RepID=UPI0033B4B63E
MSRLVIIETSAVLTADGRRDFSGERGPHGAGPRRRAGDRGQAWTAAGQPPRWVNWRRDRSHRRAKSSPRSGNAASEILCPLTANIRQRLHNPGAVTHRGCASLEG